MKLPGKIWITEENVEYGGETEPYLSINDPADLSPGAVPYVPASEADKLRKALQEALSTMQRHMLSDQVTGKPFNEDMADAIKSASEALGGGEGE